MINTTNPQTNGSGIPVKNRTEHAALIGATLIVAHFTFIPLLICFGVVAGAFAVVCFAPAVIVSLATHAAPVPLTLTGIPCFLLWCYSLVRLVKWIYRKLIKPTEPRYADGYKGMI